MVVILDDTLQIKLPCESNRISVPGQGIAMKQFLSILDTEDRENHSEILSNGSFSSPALLGLHRWD